MRTNPSVTKRKKDNFFASFEKGNNVTVREAARLAKISVPTAYSWIKQGRNTTTNTTTTTAPMTSLQSAIKPLRDQVELYKAKIQAIQEAIRTLETL